MLTIAIFVKNLTSGGAEKQAVLLARTLCSDYDVHFIIFNADKVHQKYIDLLQAEPGIVIAGFRGGQVSRFIQFVHYLKKEKIDAIFSYLTAANLYACCAGLLTGTEVFTGIRNVDLPKRKRFANCIFTNFLAKGTILNSYSGKENFQNYGYNEKKLIVIPNGFENIKSYRTRLKSDIVHVITVGRFHPQKDYKTAIRAFAKLHDVCPNTEYDIVGYGEEEKNIRDLIKKLDLETCCNIYINPDNIPELLDEADIYLSSSLKEGTCNSIMEAMNANMPIVATNVGDNCYLIEDGKSGFVLPIKDEEGLAKKMIILVKNADLRSQMGKKSKKILQKKYSVETFKEKYLRVINQLV